MTSNINIKSTSPSLSSSQIRTEEKLVHKLTNIFKNKKVKSTEDLLKKMPEIMKEVGKQKINLTVYGQSVLCNVFKEAIKNYTGTSRDVDYIELTDHPKNIINDYCRLAAETAKQDRVELPQDKESRAERQARRRFENALENIKYTSADLQKLTLASNSPIKVKNLILGGGDAATEVWLDQKKEMHQTTSQFIEDKKKPAKYQQDQNKDKQMPDHLMLATDTGNWKHDYTLAQTHSLLERPDAPVTASDFAKPEHAETNRYVNARDLYRANLTSLSETEAPLMLNIEVLSIEKRERHPEQWQDSTAGYRTRIQFVKSEEEIEVQVKTDYVYMTDNYQATIQEQMKKNLPENKKSINQEYINIKPKLDENGNIIVENGRMKFLKQTLINKEIYTEKLDICTGFGVARQLLQDNMRDAFKHFIANGQISAEDFQILSAFDPQKGYTPLCDGNTFMLTGREEGVAGTDDINYGGGGSATAVFRKIIHGYDINAEDAIYNTDTQLPNSVHWFAKEGFELAGAGKLAKDACDFAKENDLLHCGELVRITRGDDGKIHVFMQDRKGTYEKEPIIYSKKMCTQHPLMDMEVVRKDQNGNITKETVQVREFVSDRFIYSIGQESAGLRNLLKEVTHDEKNKNDLDQIKNKETDIPLGLQSKDENVRFWGAAALTVAPWVQRTEGDIDRLLAKESAARMEVKKLEKALKETRNEELKIIKARGTPESLKTIYEKKIAQLEAKYEIAMTKYQIAKLTRLEIEEKTLNREVNLIDRGLRDWIISQRIARDAEWPGVMPPSRTQVRESVLMARTELLDEAARLEKEANNLQGTIRDQKDHLEKVVEAMNRINKSRSQPLSPPSSVETLREKTRGLEEREIGLRAQVDELIEAANRKGSLTSINFNLDDLTVIDLFLKQANVEDERTRRQFTDAILMARHQAYLTEQFKGIDKSALEKMIQDYGLSDKIALKGHSSLVKKHLFHGVRS